MEGRKNGMMHRKNKGDYVDNKYYVKGEAKL